MSITKSYSTLGTTVKSLVLHGLGIACLMLAHLLIMANLEVETYGNFTIIYQTYLFCVGCATTGFAAHLLYSAPKLGPSKELVNLSCSVIGISLLVGIAILCLACLYIWDKISTGHDFLVLGILLFLWVAGGIIATLLVSLLQGLGRPSLGYAIDSLLRNGLFLLFTLVIVGCLVSPQFLPGIVTAATAAVIIAVILAIYSLHHIISSGLKPTKVLSPSHWLYQVLVLAGTGYAILIIRSADIYALAYFATPEEVALYGVSIRIAELVFIAPNLLNVIQIPRYVQHVEAGNVADLYDEIKFFQRTIAALGALTITTSLILAPIALPLLKVEYLSAYPFLTMLICGFVISSAFMNAPAVLVAMSKQVFFLTSGVATALTGVILIVLLTAQWSIWGTAAALPLAMLIMNLVWFYGMRRAIRARFS